MYALLTNLLNGFKLLVFRRVENDEFHVTHDQIFLLAVAYASTLIVTTYAFSAPNPHFNYSGFTGFSTQLILGLLLAYVLTRLSGRQELFPVFQAVIFAMLPWMYLLMAMTQRSPYSLYWYESTPSWGDWVVTVWIAGAAILALGRVCGTNVRRWMLITVSYILIMAVPSLYVSLSDFWYGDSNQNDAYAAYKLFNQEDLYYKQAGLLSTLNKQLLRSQAQNPHVYFVGFGSYGWQDVFMKEVQYAKNLFETRFSASGRSVALINNVKTIETLPLATKSNLDRLLADIGKKMNIEQDVLFLYLTSHGSKKPRLSVDFYSLQLNSLDAKDIQTSLINAGIKWRVVLVSACYSGGFVEPLQDDYSVIFTAADKEHRSFGCGDREDFTYFGRAVFQEQLAHSFDFLGAFQRTIESIKLREQREKLEHSNPQLYIGTKIRTKLAQLGKHLENLYNHGQH